MRIFWATSFTMYLFIFLLRRSAAAAQRKFCASFAHILGNFIYYLVVNFPVAPQRKFCAYFGQLHLLFICLFSCCAAAPQRRCASFAYILGKFIYHLVANFLVFQRNFCADFWQFHLLFRRRSASFAHILGNVI